MLSDDYLQRLYYGGVTLNELAEREGRAERGCTDCGRRLTLDSEVEVGVCHACQDVFLRECIYAEEWRALRAGAAE